MQRRASTRYGATIAPVGQTSMQRVHVPQCAVAGATSPCCQDDAMCAAFVGCVLDGGNQATCAMEYPEGAESLQHKRVRACIGDELAEDHAVIPEGAVLEFLAPVSGG